MRWWWFAARTEAQAEPGIVSLEVLRGDDGAQDVTVDFSTMAGSALPGSDYLQADGTLVFHEGEAAKLIKISIATNDVLETDELFTVQLSNPAGIALGQPSKSTVRILNGQPTLLNPVVLASVPFAEPEPNSQAVGIAVQEDRAYMVYTKGLAVFDISDPELPVAITNIPIDGAQDIEVAGKYAFLTTWQGSLVVCDIEQPSVPKIVAKVDGIGAGIKLVISGHHAYVAATFEGLAIIDVADPLQPVFLTNQPIAGTYI